jgi:hypothetical protein
MTYKYSSFILILILILLTSCSPVLSKQTSSPETFPTQALPDETAANTEAPAMNQTSFANVLSVQVMGNLGAFQFAVEIASPDTGCEQYADWWEIVSEDGQLLYRRILLHSHVDEQPFIRSGGPVDISTDEVVYVRAHMNTTGYGGVVMKGTVQGGFKPVELEAGFGDNLERVQPQPEDCAF